MNKANGLKTLIAAGLIFGAGITSQAQTWFEGIYNNKPGIENSRNRMRINAKKTISFENGQSLALYGFSEIYNNGSFTRFLPTYNFASLGEEGNHQLGVTLNTKHIHQGKISKDFAAVGFAYTYLSKNKNTFVSAKALAPAYHVQDEGFEAGGNPTGVTVGLAASQGWKSSIGDFKVSAFAEFDVSNLTFVYGEGRGGFTPIIKDKKLPVSVQVGVDMLSDGTVMPTFDIMAGITYTIK